MNVIRMDEVFSLLNGTDRVLALHHEREIYFKERSEGRNR